MDVLSQSILADLKTAEGERLRRRASPALLDKVVELKAFQRARFARCYADLLSTPRYAPAARFFLDELYGPSDFAQRDTQFARVVPALVRVFPIDVVETVAMLAQLHALSEKLDTAMAGVLLAGDGEINSGEYIAAWQSVGQADSRALSKSASRCGLRLASSGSPADKLCVTGLLLMRAPARAAGLGKLQKFLEVGFEAFRAMDGADAFIATLDSRERAVAASIFAATDQGRRLDPGLVNIFSDAPNAR